MQLNVVQYNSIELNEDQYSSIQFNTAQHTSMQLNAAQRRSMQRQKSLNTLMFCLSGARWSSLKPAEAQWSEAQCNSMQLKDAQNMSWVRALARPFGERSEPLESDGNCSNLFGSVRICWDRTDVQSSSNCFLAQRSEADYCLSALPVVCQARFQENQLPCNTFQ